jgi:hypothetical protein
MIKGKKRECPTTITITTITISTTTTTTTNSHTVSQGPRGGMAFQLFHHPSITGIYILYILASYHDRCSCRIYESNILGRSILERGGRNKEGIPIGCRSAGVHSSQAAGCSSDVMCMQSSSSCWREYCST